MSLLLLRFSLTNIYWQYLTTGLDPSGYRQSARQQEMDDDDDALLGVEMADEEKYKDCERFKFTCPAVNCGREIIFDSVFTGAVSNMTLDVDCMFTRVVSDILY